MTYQKAIEILKDYINHSHIINDEDFKTVLIMAKWALSQLKDSHQFYHEIFGEALISETKE